MLCLGKPLPIPAATVKAADPMHWLPTELHKSCMSTVTLDTSCAYGERGRKLSTEELMLLNYGVGEDSWESLGLQGVHPKGGQSWVFIGRTDAEAETPILWSPHAKSWLIGKDPDAGRDWGQEKKAWDGWMASPIRWAWVWVNSGNWWWTDREAWRAVIHGVTKSRTRLSDWTELKSISGDCDHSSFLLCLNFYEDDYRALEIRKTNKCIQGISF